MKNKDLQITEQQLEEALHDDMKQLLNEVTGALNNARDGKIIADSEDIVRDAMAHFRRIAYQKALELKTQAAQAAFSPSADKADKKMEK
jgi:hypothetical protein